MQRERSSRSSSRHKSTDGTESAPDAWASPAGLQAIEEITGLAGIICLHAQQLIAAHGHRLLPHQRPRLRERLLSELQALGEARARAGVSLPVAFRRKLDTFVHVFNGVSAPPAVENQYSPELTASTDPGMSLSRALLELESVARKALRANRLTQPNERTKHAMASKAKILFLAANPTTSAKLSLDEEARAIEEKLAATEHREAFEFKTKWAVRPDDLQDALLREQPTIVHFSGHGNGIPGLVFHGNAQGQQKLVTAESLRHLFATLKDNIRVTVLNACYSEEQAKAIVKEIDFVVGMKDSISDTSARLFAASFYRGLGFGRTVANAFELGIGTLKMEGLGDEDLPVLLIRAGMSGAVPLVGSALTENPQ